MATQKKKAATRTKSLEREVGEVWLTYEVAAHAYSKKLDELRGPVLAAGRHVSASSRTISDAEHMTLIHLQEDVEKLGPLVCKQFSFLVSQTPPAANASPDKRASYYTVHFSKDEFIKVIAGGVLESHKSKRSDKFEHITLDQFLLQSEAGARPEKEFNAMFKWVGLKVEALKTTFGQLLDELHQDEEGEPLSELQQDVIEEIVQIIPALIDVLQDALDLWEHGIEATRKRNLRSLQQGEVPVKRPREEEEDVRAVSSAPSLDAMPVASEPDKKEEKEVRPRKTARTSRNADGSRSRSRSDE
jgi:hypothetical protein